MYRSPQILWLLDSPVRRLAVRLIWKTNRRDVAQPNPRPFAGCSLRPPSLQETRNGHIFIEKLVTCTCPTLVAHKMVVLLMHWEPLAKGDAVNRGGSFQAAFQGFAMSERFLLKKLSASCCCT